MCVCACLSERLLFLKAACASCFFDCFVQKCCGTDDRVHVGFRDSQSCAWVSGRIDCCRMFLFGVCVCRQCSAPLKNSNPARCKTSLVNGPMDGDSQPHPASLTCTTPAPCICPVSPSLVLHQRYSLLMTSPWSGLKGTCPCSSIPPPTFAPPPRPNPSLALGDLEPPDPVLQFPYRWWGAPSELHYVGKALSGGGGKVQMHFFAFFCTFHFEPFFALFALFCIFLHLFPLPCQSCFRSFDVCDAARSWCVGTYK